VGGEEGKQVKGGSCSLVGRILTVFFSCKIPKKKHEELAMSIKFF